MLCILHIFETARVPSPPFSRLEPPPCESRVAAAHLESGLIQKGTQHGHFFDPKSWPKANRHDQIFNQDMNQQVMEKTEWCPTNSVMKYIAKKVLFKIVNFSQFGRPPQRLPKLKRKAEAPGHSVIRTYKHLHVQASEHPDVRERSGVGSSSVQVFEHVCSEIRLVTSLSNTELTNHLTYI